MPFLPGQSGNPGGRSRNDKLLTDAIRIAVLKVDPATGKRKLQLIAERLVAKAIEGDNWCIGQVGDRLDGKPKERQEHAGHFQDAVHIIWDGMPIPSTSETGRAGNRHK
jgi:hypothetical protein